MREGTEQRRSAVVSWDGVSTIARHPSLLATVLAATVDPIYQFDRTGRILFANPAGTRTQGLTPADVVGKTWQDLGISSDLVEPFNRLREEAFATGAPVAGKVCAATINGPRDFEYVLTPIRGADGSVESVVATVHDVTERKQAEREREQLLARERAARAEAETTASDLREITEQLLLSRLQAQDLIDQVQAERNRLQQIVDVLPAGLMIADSSGHYVMTNPVAREMLGMDLTGRPVLTNGRPDYDARYLDGTPYDAAELPLHRALLHGEVTRGEQMVVRSAKTNQEIPILANSAPLGDATGRVTGAVVVLQDITVLRALERMRDEWTSVIAHDLRQPVTIIRGYASLLARILGERAEMQRENQLLEHVQVASLNLSRMIADLLDMSRIDARRLKIRTRPIALVTLVREVVERSAAVTPHHALRVDVRSDLPPLEADPERIEQVLGNLLSNAAKYSYPNSEIQVTVERKDGEAEVSVMNAGAGIPPDELPDLFQRFHRTRQVTEQNVAGVGLGLYIAKGLVEAHGGRIGVDSIPGQTTVFHFTLPLQRPD